MLEGHASEKFHGDERFALLFADIKNGANVGMIQGRGGLRFALKTSQGLRVAGNRGWQKFQRHQAAQAGVFRLINDSHAATAKFFQHGVVRKGAADNGGRVRHAQGV